MRTAAVRQMKVLDASGTPWRPTLSQYVALEGDSPFKGASYNRRAGALWNTSGGSANSDFLPDQDTLRRRSRDQVRNNPLAAGALLSLLSNVIGDGLQVLPRVKRRVLGISKERAAEVQNMMRDEFTLFAESKESDLERQENFYGKQQLAFNSTMESGDALLLMPVFKRAGAVFDTRIQVVESDRIANPQNQLFNTDRLAGGVELDTNGATIAYHVRTQHPGDRFGFMAKSVRVAAYAQSTGRRNASLLVRRRRPGQTRGEPYLVPVLEHLKQLERYTDGELHASVIGGSFTVFVESPTGEGLMPLASAPLQSTGTAAATATDIALDYGAIVDLAPGEKISVANPGRPNQAFGEFVTAIIQQIAAGLGLPFELLLRHFTASYSASRGALLEAWKFFRMIRAWFAENFCAPVYEAVMTEAVLREFIDLPGFLEDARMRQAYLGALWLGPAPGQLNPVVEVEAAEKKIAIGVSTLERETAEISGDDWEEVLEQRVTEVHRRRAAGLEPELSTASGPTARPGANTPRPDPDKQEEEET